MQDLLYRSEGIKIRGDCAGNPKATAGRKCGRRSGDMQDSWYPVSPYYHFVLVILVRSNPIIRGGSDREQLADVLKRGTSNVLRTC